MLQRIRLLDDCVEKLNGRRVIERAPAEIKRQRDIWGASGDDFDLFLVSGTTIVALSWYIQDGNDDPWEGLYFYNDTGSDMDVWIGVFEFRPIDYFETQPEILHWRQTDINPAVISFLFLQVA